MSKLYKGNANPEIMYLQGSYIPSVVSENNEKYQDENSRYNCVRIHLIDWLVFATFSTIGCFEMVSFLLVEETGEPGENHQPSVGKTNNPDFSGAAKCGIH